jgi:C_GCAxxG_C_C family probable redox protein
MTSMKPIGETNKIGRRTFLTKCVGCTAGLTLLAFPGMTVQRDKSKEEVFKELEEKAGEFMPMYGACSSASFAALNEQFNLKADNAIRPLMPFAGGIAGKGETCGAVSGSILALGFFFEPIDRKRKELVPASMKNTGVFMDRFTKEFGSTRCREVVKHQYGRYYDFGNPEEQKLFMEASQKSGKCLEVVQRAVLIAGDIILNNL